MDTHTGLSVRASVRGNVYHIIDMQGLTATPSSSPSTLGLISPLHRWPGGYALPLSCDPLVWGQHSMLRDSPVALWVGCLCLGRPCCTRDMRVRPAVERVPLCSYMLT